MVKFFVRTCFLVAGIAILYWSVALFAFEQTPAPVTTETPTPKEDVARTIGTPQRIVIKKIGVDAIVEPMGLTAEAALAAPTDPMVTGWYAAGPRPGEPGNAVIDGHVNWWFGATAVFAELHTLIPGDVITVQDEYGTETSFVVKKLRIYDDEADATTVFIAADDGAHLNLITCSGVWDPITRQLTERLVVFADKQE